MAEEPLFAATRTVLTIHNIGYQGIFSATQVADLGLRRLAEPAASGRPGCRAHQRAAPRHPVRGRVTTVSPTHAREICTDEYGMGMQDSLRARGAAGAVFGILNGVDYDEWDPRRDRYLPPHYDAGTPRGEGGSSSASSWRAASSASRRTVPLAGIVSRLAVQKGIELMYEALPKVLERGRSGCAPARQRRAAVRGVLHHARAALPGARELSPRLRR